jgi:hypothetical protein
MRRMFELNDHYDKDYGDRPLFAVAVVRAARIATAARRSRDYLVFENGLASGDVSAKKS